MKYLKINLENYGGSDVHFPLRKIEFKARVKTDARLRKMDRQKFEECYLNSFVYVQNNIKSFYSIDVCEGPDWDFFREALVDTLCKNYAITYKKSGAYDFLID